VKQCVVLDTGPLSLVTNPRQSPQSRACAEWLRSLVVAENRVVVPENADYELRRELLRANKVRGIANLDRLISLIEYLPITTAAMRRAAGNWAQARRQGHPTANDNTIDADMILAAQAVGELAAEVVVEGAEVVGAEVAAGDFPRAAGTK
jgi:predicted nucleic acid-binding protein